MFHGDFEKPPVFDISFIEILTNNIVLVLFVTHLSNTMAVKGPNEYITRQNIIVTRMNFQIKK